MGISLYFPSDGLNPFPNNPWFLRVCSTSLLKTLREKEKLLVTNNFSFSHSVFYPFLKLLPFSSTLKWSSASSFNLKRLKFLLWERVNLHTYDIHPLIQVAGCPSDKQYWKFYRIKKKRPVTKKSQMPQKAFPVIELCT